MIRFYTIVLLSLSIGFFSQINAQVNEGGIPLTQSLDNKSNLQEVPVSIMPSIDVEQLRAEDLVYDTQRDRPFRFGENIEVNNNLQNSGVWDEIKGYRVWRLGIKSEGALSLNFLFDEYILPENAKLFIYSKDGNEILGAFTHKNNQADLMFATMLIHTDEVIIEYIEPHDVAFRGKLNLSRVTHGYRNSSTKHSDFGSSGSCNLNVECDESLGWDEEIRSVARMVVNGNSWCSGQLINNTANDGTPYFLSANHCFTNPGQVVFWFNYQSDTCQNPTSPPSHDAVSGATTVARFGGSDMWLMQLNQEPPSEYEVFYAGWNATMDDEIEGLIVGIHHPAGDIKKFSYTYDGVTTSTYLGNPGSGTTHWRVGFWEGGTTTEPGSSGSAIFDSNTRIIGQLHGGYAACGNTREDWYGKLGVSWTGGGSPTTRLSDWLDPLGIGVTEWDGYDPMVATLEVDAQLSGISSPRGGYLLGDEIIPHITIRNAGINNITEATIQYGISGLTNESYEWNGVLETGDRDQLMFDELNLPAGEYEFFATIQASGDENPDNDTAFSAFSIVDCSATPSLPYIMDFDGSNATECWQFTDNIGSGQTWQVGNIGSRGISGNSSFYAYLDSDAYGNGNSQNSDLISPRFNLSNYDDIELSFTHYFRQYQSSTATFSYSIDGGESWVAVESWTTDISNPSQFSQSFPEMTGESEVYFKWNFTGSWDWYWSVDDITITGTKVAYDPAYVQILHHSADATLEEVSIWWNDEVLEESLSYLHFSEYMIVDSMEEGILSVRSINGDTVYYSESFQMAEQDSSGLVLVGLVNPADHLPNPDGISTELSFLVLDDEKETPDQNNVSISVFNATTDLKAFSLVTYQNEVLAENLEYGNLISGAIDLTNDVHHLILSSDDLEYVFEADFSLYGGESVIISTFGFAKGTDESINSQMGLVLINDDGELIELRNATSSDQDLDQLPESFSLSQNYPNPFNPVTQISYSIPQDSNVRVEVFNISGQRVALLQDSNQSAGVYTLSFDASRLSSGVYIYRMTAGSFIDSRKMLLIK